MMDTPVTYAFSGSVLTILPFTNSTALFSVHLSVYNSEHQPVVSLCLCAGMSSLQCIWAASWTWRSLRETFGMWSTREMYESMAYLLSTVSIHPVLTTYLIFDILYPETDTTAPHLWSLWGRRYPAPPNGGMLVS